MSESYPYLSYVLGLVIGGIVFGLFGTFIGWQFAKSKYQKEKA